MKKVAQLLATVSLAAGITTLAASPTLAQGGVAVAGFETDGSVGLPRADYDALGRAMTVMLGTDLASHATGPVVEIKSAGGVRMGRVDLTRARAAATQAGAKYVVVGTILDQYGDVRVEARLVNAATGDPVAVIRADKGHTKREQLAESVTDLAIGLGARAELGGSRKGGERGATSVEAMVSFGQGLRFEDVGDKAKAAEAYRAAIKLAPALQEASAALQRVGG
jgi:TolB-like protein